MWKPTGGGRRLIGEATKKSKAEVQCEASTFTKATPILVQKPFLGFADLLVDHGHELHHFRIHFSVSFCWGAELLSARSRKSGHGRRSLRMRALAFPDGPSPGGKAVKARGPHPEGAERFQGAPIGGSRAGRAEGQVGGAGRREREDGKKKGLRGRPSKSLGERGADGRGQSGAVANSGAGSAFTALSLTPTRVWPWEGLRKRLCRWSEGVTGTGHRGPGIAA